jgi:hypothetical protein
MCVAEAVPTRQTRQYTKSAQHLLTGKTSIVFWAIWTLARPEQIRKVKSEVAEAYPTLH